MRVKVCGIKNTKDALMTIQSGADAIGLLVGRKYSSDDFISEETAKAIVEACPPYVTAVMVTHLEEPAEIFKIASYIGVHTIQLHSSFEVENIKKLRQLFKVGKFISNIKIIKSIHVDSCNLSDVLKNIYNFQDDVDAFIVDTINKLKNQIGGTGVVHDWTISRKIVECSNCPIILAGGLNANNVVEAIRKVMPYGVDANSGLKNSAGDQDLNKTTEFIYRAKLEFLGDAKNRVCL